MFLATKPMRIGERQVQPGDKAPEVAGFAPQVIRRLLATNFVIYDPAVVTAQHATQEVQHGRRQSAQ